MSQRVLITRPREDAEPLAELLRRRGLTVAFEPLLAIAPLPSPIDLDGVQALLLTSANGARALAAATPARTVPVFAVGDATARAARDLGFTTVASAAGDVDTLAALVKERLDPAAGALLHAAGSVTAGDMAGLLTAAGFAVRKVRLYEAVTATALSGETAALLREGAIPFVLFYSPRTAATFANLVRFAGLEYSLAAVTAHCLSAAVRDRLGGLPWKAVRVAARPDQESLLAGLDGDLTAAEPETDSMNTRPDTPETAGETAVPVATDARPEETADVAAAVPRRGGGAKVAASLLGLLVLAGAGGYASLPWWRDRVPAELQVWLPPTIHADARRAEGAAATAEPARRDLGAVATRVERLAEAMAALDRRLAVTEAPTKAGTEPGDADVTQRLATLEGRTAEQAKNDAEMLGSLEKRVEALDAAVGALSDRLATLAKSQVSAPAMVTVQERLAVAEELARKAASHRDTSLALVLAVAQLREAVGRGSPFAAELRAVEALADDAGVVAQATQGFAAYAAKGMPTRPTLERRFTVLTPDVARAAVAPEGSGWRELTLQRLMAVVTVQRTDGEAAGEGAAAIMARASARLGEGDLAAAVREVATLTGAPAEAAAGWLKDAKARVAADDGLSALTARALGRAAAARTGG